MIPKEISEAEKTINDLYNAEDYHRAIELIKTLDREYVELYKRKPMAKAWQWAVRDYFGDGEEVTNGEHVVAA